MCDLTYVNLLREKVRQLEAEEKRALRDVRRLTAFHREAPRSARGIKDAAAAVRLWGKRSKLAPQTLCPIERFNVMADTSDPPSFGVADSPHAPFIYYEAAPAVGTDFGVIQITLSAHRLLIGSRNETIAEPIAVAHLRGTRNAARLLRDALNTALSEPE